MEIETVKALVDGTGPLAASTGIVTSVMGYLEAEALGIGALCTMITLVVYIFFQFLHHKKLGRADENKIKIDLILAELKDMKNKDKGD